jgi:hypothetical protein
MKQQKTLRKALQDPNLLGRALDGETWAGWRGLLLALAGEPLQPDELEIFTKLTGRSASPSEWVKEFYGIVGRRGGKSRAMGVLAAYLATLCQYPMLVSGERGVVMVIAPDQRQATAILGYAAGALEESPILRQRIVRRTADTIELKGNIFVEVRAASFRRLRGATLVAALLDEFAFFLPDENSSNPDTEIVNAIKPSLLTTGGPLIGISSPYARRGILWEAYNRDFGPDGNPWSLRVQAAISIQACRKPRSISSTKRTMPSPPLNTVRSFERTWKASCRRRRSTPVPTRISSGHTIPVLVTRPS